MGTSLKSGRARHPRRRVAAVVAVVCLVALVAGAVYLHQRDHYVPVGGSRGGRRPQAGVSAQPPLARAPRLWRGASRKDWRVYLPLNASFLIGLAVP